MFEVLQAGAASNKTYVSVSNRGEGALNIALTKQAKAVFNVKIITLGTAVYVADGMIDAQFISALSQRFSELNGGVEMLPNVL